MPPPGPAPGLNFHRPTALSYLTSSAAPLKRPSMASEGKAPESGPEPEPAGAAARRAWQGSAKRGEVESRASGRRVKILLVTGLLAFLAATAIAVVSFIALPAKKPH